MRAGVDSAMYAWRRANVAELNALARKRWAAEGRLRGPEVVARGGRRYAAGDLIITLAPGPDAVLVTSEHGTVDAVDPATGEIRLRMADHRLVKLDRKATTSDKLDYGYALTVHRSQGDTTGTAHRYADGGGRELGYVSMSRAVDRSTIHVVADDLDQARADLVQDWSAERRQRWAIDTGTPTTHVADIEHEPDVPTRLQNVILRSERDAVARSIPPDVSRELNVTRNRLARLSEEKDGLERGSGGYMYTPEGRVGFAVQAIRSNLADAERRAADRRFGRAERRQARAGVETLRPRLEAALTHWKEAIGPKHAGVVNEIEDLGARIADLEDAVLARRDWLERHPEALPRLEWIDRDLAALRPAPAIDRPLAVGLEPLGRDLGRDFGGPGLSL